MTLGELLEYWSDHPGWLILYFAMLPITALLAWLIGRHEGHISPWCNLYALLIYLTCIPGIFAIALTAYLVLFEEKSILDLDIYIQVLPVLSMIITLLLIKKNVNFDVLPGFKKLSGLMIIIAGIMILMALVDKTRLVVFSYIPFTYLLLIFLLVLVLVVFGVSRLFSSSKID